MKKRFLCLFLLILAIALCACSSEQRGELQDGYYTAEEKELNDKGWKEFITIYVSNHRIVTVEYNAKNVSGMVKSWDMDYMRSMERSSNTYPNEYTRIYAAELLSKQDPARVDAISGATHSHGYFTKLAEAAIAQSRAGDKSVAFVDLSPQESNEAEG